MSPEPLAVFPVILGTGFVVHVNVVPVPKETSPVKITFKATPEQIASVRGVLVTFGFGLILTV